MASVFRAIIAWFQHTATRRWLPAGQPFAVEPLQFQHTAARRRLLGLWWFYPRFRHSFNTQPPEGGCNQLSKDLNAYTVFQHTAARRRLPQIKYIAELIEGFNTQPPEGGCVL